MNMLTDSEVRNLINSLKNCQKEIPNEIPLIGKIKDDTPVIDFKYHIQYKLHRYRNPIDDSRFSLHIRFKDSNEHLIRVDINNGTHLNPDRVKIPQNHMHIYHYDPDLSKDAVAVPLPDEISDLSSLFSVLTDFLIYTNTSAH
ncbi:hypothetical protein BCY75_05660 [Latilactobacillus curvatus]|uniref:DUF6978 family protein n=1 Tax=Latilactobacillus curvatus TaxID=28038 RepID=UPI000814FF66|nr:hypothetical protein [Latilactobacillus curvatus]ANY14370.1 hypothetical protein BCY75_05660 [Latilactobacillus curvatus]